MIIKIWPVIFNFIVVYLSSELRRGEGLENGGR
jgi:hypothetical protein